MMNPVQGSSSNARPPAAVQQQQTTPPQQQSAGLTQAQLTYAQKVKGQNQGRGAFPMMNGGGQPLPRQSFMGSAQSTGNGRPVGGNTVPSKLASSGTAATAKMATASSSQSGLGGQQQQQQAPQSQPPQQPQQQQTQRPASTQQQFRMVPTGPLLQTSALQNYAYPYNYSSLQQRTMPNYPSRAQPHSRSAYSRQPYARSAGSYGAGAGQRDFFERRVQSNLNHAVNRYYNYPSSSSRNYMSPSLARSQNTNRWAAYMQNMGRNSAVAGSYGRRRGSSSHRGGPSSAYGARRGGARGGGGGYPSQRGPPSYSASGPSRDGGYMKNGNVMSGAQRAAAHSGPDGRVRAQRGKPTDSQLKNYENAADRDVLCWIYENQGKCRYGPKCQWLHLCRETGQYIPTVYMTNSLDIAPSDGDKEEEHGPAGKGADDEKESEQEEDEAVDEALKSKFQAMMERNIRNKAEEERTRKVDHHEEDNKEDADPDPDSAARPRATERCIVINGERAKGSGGGKGGDEAKEESGGSKGKDGQYGSYGTTFDRFNVCWEFNTFVGCRKGAKCKWAHAYLVKESAHPYTGEKLNGMAVRKFRLSNNI